MPSADQQTNAQASGSNRHSVNQAQAERRRRGRNQRRRSHVGRTRQPNLRRFYRHKARAGHPGDFDFHVILIKRGGRRFWVSLDKVTESLDWADESAVMEGTLTLRKAHGLHVSRGMRVRLRVRPRGAHADWVDLWTMRVGKPEYTKPDGTISVPLKDDMEALRRNKRYWSFRKTKSRKKGWLAHEVALAVAKKANVKVGHIAKGKEKLPKIVGTMTDLDAIRKAYKHEKEKTGRRFVIRMRRNRLEVVPYRRNPVLYQFGDRLMSAVLTQEGPDRPTTVIVAKGRIGKGKDAKKVEHRYYKRSAVRQLGKVELEKNYGTVDSLDDLRKKARTTLAEKLRPRRVGTLVTPGIPWVRRGDAIRWFNDEPGWHGATKHSKDRTFIFVRSARHSVSSSGYTTEMDVTQVDPYVKDRERRDKEARARKRKERKRDRKRGDHSG